MKGPAIRKAWKLLKIVAIVYVAAGIALYFLQEKFLFHPKKLDAGHVFSFDASFRELNLPANGGNINIIQFTVPDSICKGIVLYFHGNRQNIIRYAPLASNFTRNGFEVWMMDYPGFGKSTGKRTEQILYDNALRKYELAVKRFSSDSIIIYGKSIGTGIAAQLASVRDCQRLILETPYYSIDALARHYFFMYPVMPLTKYTLPTHHYLKTISAPVTMFHGSRDEVIPFNHARRLKKENPNAELVTLDKGKHNNLNEFPLYHQKIDSLLKLQAD
jgi:alpha-beta hydrolase superfamily lysophospholipase